MALSAVANLILETVKEIANALGARFHLRVFQTAQYSRSLKDKNFNIKEMVKNFLSNGGKIFACGTCLKSRHKEGTAICPLSTMQDLMNIVEESDKIVSF